MSLWKLRSAPRVAIASALTMGGSVASAPAPTIGVAGQGYQIHTAGTTPITITVGDTQASGSSLLFLVGTDLDQITTATHNKTGTVSQLANAELAAWAPYGGRLWGISDLQGGTGQTVSVAVQAGAATIEKTLCAVEVIGGQSVTAGTPEELPASAGSVVTSPAMSTTSAGVVLCFVIGDANVSNPLDLLVHADSTGEGWEQLCDVSVNSEAHVQMAVAAREVSGAGSYSCKWNFTPAQRGLFFMARVQ